MSGDKKGIGGLLQTPENKPEPSRSMKAAFAIPKIVSALEEVEQELRKPILQTAMQLVDCVPDDGVSIAAAEERTKARKGLFG